MIEVDTDILVIGGGLAGIVAALRIRRPEASASLPARVTVLEGEKPGGCLNWGGRNAFHIAGPKYKLGEEDWATLMDDARVQGVELVGEGVVGASLEGPIKELVTTAGRTLRSHAVIIASGAFPLKNAARYRRRDGLVTTFGSASAIRATLARLMQKTGRKKLLLVGTPAILELAHLLSELSPEVIVDAPFEGAGLPHGARFGSLERIVGEPRITGVEYRDHQGALRELSCDTIYADFNAFMERTTATRYLQGSGVALDKGFVVTDRDLATPLSGVFAAGDVTGGMFAVSKSIYEGNRAGFSALGWLHRARFGFEPSFHPFYHGRFGAELGRFHKRSAVSLLVSGHDSDAGLEVETPTTRVRYGLTTELVPLANAVAASEGTFRPEELGVPVDGVAYALLFELVRIGALGVGYPPYLAP